MRRRAFLREGARWTTAAGFWISGGGVLARAGATVGQAAAPGAAPRKVALVWSEGTAPREAYPNDINAAVAEGLRNLRGWDVRIASITDPEMGLAPAALDAADVLVWWGHTKHGQIPDALVERIVGRVRDGRMGFVALHSAHHAKAFRALLGGATGNWAGGAANDGKPNRITVADKRHPIARGVRDFTIPREERYDGKFEVPTPDAIVLNGVYEGNNTEGWQGLAWNVGKGRVFYFRPGHETYPVYFQPEVRRVLRNAVLWAGGDEAGIREDNDPGAVAARGSQEPPLAEIVARFGYGGTDVTAAGEVDARRFVKAGPGPVTFRPLAAYGLLETCSAGYYTAAAGAAAGAPRRTPLWRVDGPRNKQDRPPLMPGARTAFDPGRTAFGLWVATAGFPGETVYTEDALQAAIARFPADRRHKAHVYAAVKDDGAPVPNTYLIGWEYSTNDDNQDIVTLIENVRPAAAGP